MKKVVVCTVTYNHRKFIGECIKSVLMQESSMPIIQYIAEDCSTDGTREICEKYAAKYPDRIKLLLQNKNKGILQNSMDLLDLVLSDSDVVYVALLDGDDFYCDKKAIEKRLSFFQTHDGYGLVHANFSVCKEGEIMSIKPRKSSEVPQGDILPIVVRKALFGTLTIMIKAEYLRNIPFDEIRELPLLGTDHIINVHVAAQSKIGFIEDVIAVYRRHEGNTTVTNNLSKTLAWIEHECAQGRWLNDHFSCVKFGAEEELHHRANSQFCAYVRAGKYREAKDILTQYPFVKSENHRFARITSAGYMIFMLYFCFRIIKRKLRNIISS